MRQAQWEARASESCERLRVDREGYERHLARMLLLGPVALGGAVLMFLGIALILALHVAIIPAIVAAIAGLALVPAVIMPGRLPQEMELDVSNAPRLMADIRGIASLLQTEMPDHVYLVDGMNASAGSVGRFGPFGSRTFVQLGSRLLATLERDEVCAVIAHELGHHLGRHTQLARRAWVAGAAWSNVLARVEVGSWLYRPLAPFARWYVPRLTADMLAIDQRSEREADLQSARACGPDCVARALVSIHVRGPLVDDHPGSRGSCLYPAMVAHETPPPDLWMNDLVGAQGVFDPVRVRQALGGALADETSVLAEHPGLEERLSTIGRPLALGPGEQGLPVPWAIDVASRARRESGWSAYVEPALQRAFVEREAALHSGSWTLTRSHAAAALEEHRVLAERAAREALSPHEYLMLAMARREAGDTAGERGWLVHGLERHPYSLELRLELGIQLLWAGDASAAAQLEYVAAHDLAMAARVEEEFEGWQFVEGRREQAMEHRARSAERMRTIRHGLDSYMHRLGSQLPPLATPVLTRLQHELLDRALRVHEGVVRFTFAQAADLDPGCGRMLAFVLELADGEDYEAVLIYQQLMEELKVPGLFGPLDLLFPYGGAEAEALLRCPAALDWTPAGGLQLRGQVGTMQGGAAAQAAPRAA